MHFLSFNNSVLFGDNMKEKVLRLLETNAKLTSLDIAKMLGTTDEIVETAIAEMIADKVICGYKAIINWDKISNENVNALIEVKVTPQRGTGFDKIANRIANFDEVDSVFLISGTYDFLVQIKGKSMQAISQFVFDKLATLETVQSTATHFVLKKYKDHGVNFSDNKSDSRANIIL